LSSLMGRTEPIWHQWTARVVVGDVLIDSRLGEHGDRPRRSGLAWNRPWPPSRRPSSGRAGHPGDVDGRSPGYALAPCWRLRRGAGSSRPQASRKSRKWRRPPGHPHSVGLTAARWLSSQRVLRGTHSTPKAIQNARRAGRDHVAEDVRARRAGPDQHPATPSLIALPCLTVASSQKVLDIYRKYESLIISAH
jgi:hypothetical protein